MIGCDCEVCRSLDYRDKRLRVSVFIEVDSLPAGQAGKNLVIDTGPDFRQQMLRERVKNLDAVLLTHSHKDHIAGLDDVRAFNFLQKKGMPIYGTAHTFEQIRREYYYAFEGEKYPGIPVLNLHEITGAEFSIDGITITPLPVMHMKMPVLGFRFGKFSYVTDANRIDEDEKEKIRGSEIFVVNVLRKQSHVSHFSLGEAIDLVQELNIPTVYFTHISHQLGLHQAIEAELPARIHLAYDGLILNV